MAPIQTIISIYIVYMYIGYVCFIGLVILLLFIPFNSFNGRIFLKVRTRVAALSDIRIRIVNEIIKGMRVIKMYAWENHFSKLVSESRRYFLCVNWLGDLSYLTNHYLNRREMAKIRHATFLRAMNISISVVSGRVIMFAMFITYVFLGNTLNADKAFVTMFVINTVRFTMTWLFPNSIALLSEVYVSCKRIQVCLFC